MPEITLVRQNPEPITEEDRATTLRVICGMVDGLGERGRKQWRGFWRRMFKLEPGEMVEVSTNQERIGWYHRKHMAMEQALFEQQERFEDFESFRTWMKVGAGFVTWHPGAKGGVFPVPRSISFAKLEQGEMEQFHRDAVNFLRTEHAGKTLWRHLSPVERITMLESVLGGFGE